MRESRGARQQRTRSIVAVVALATLAVGANHALAETLAQRLEKLLTTLPDARVQCAARIVDLSNGRTVFEHEPDTRMIPASNQKILVLAAAVDRFDASAGFETVLGIRGEDLVVIGGGDPALGDPELAEARGMAPAAFLNLWSHALSAAGRAQIAGNLIVDATIFDDTYQHPDWETEDLVRWYGAPTGGLNFANNCVEITVWPDDQNGAPARWSLDPPTTIFQMDNRCRSRPNSNSGTPAIGRLPGSFELALSGSAHNRVTLQAISVPDPVRFAADVIDQHFRDAGISIAGQVRYARVRRSDDSLPPDLTVLSRTRTPLADVLQRIGRNSQNMCAEALFKRLGYEQQLARGSAEPVGSWRSGREAVAAFCHKIGCDLNTIVIADGSGLSRRNRATASEFTRVLQTMFEHPRRDLFLTSLAGNRTGGTLQRRMRNIAGDVYAKSGYMTGVRALSGFVRTSSNRWFAFSVMYNGFNGSSRPYNDKLRDMCQLLSDAS